MKLRFAPYALLSPALISVVAVMLACLGVLIVLSVATQTYLTIEYAPTLANFAQAAESPIVHNLLLRSVLIAAIVTVLAVTLAFPIAYIIALDLTKRKLLWLVLFTLPCWISYLLRILSWKLILGNNGLINATLTSLGLTDEPLAFLLYNPISVTIALVHAWAPFAILPIFVSLEKIDRNLLQASADLGERPWRTFLRVTLPLSAPGIGAAALLIFVPTLGDYVTPQLIGGRSGLMIGNYIASQFGASNNWPLGAAVALVAMAAATLVVTLALVLPRVWRSAARQV